MKKNLSKVMVITLVISMFFTMNVHATDENSMIDSTVNYLVNTYSNPGYGNEWNIIAMARSYNKVDQSYFEKYYANIVEKMKKEASKKVPFSEDYDNDDYGMSSTDVERVTIALSSINKDPTNVGGVNLIDALWHWQNLGDNTGINELTYALIALDTKEYKEPEGTVNTRNSIIKKMLEVRTKDGGFSYITGGDTADVDSTAMALQALYKYKNRDDVKEVINTCLNILKNRQSQDGDYVSVWMGNTYESPCSAAEVVVALDNLGIDLTDPKNGFVKNNKNLIDVMKNYYVNGGGFKNAISETRPNEISTYELTYAMDSYLRFKNKHKTLYDMTDSLTKIDSEKQPTSKPQAELPKKNTIEDKGKIITDKSNNELKDNNLVATTRTNDRETDINLVPQVKDDTKAIETCDFNNYKFITLIMLFAGVVAFKLNRYNKKSKLI